MKSMRYLKILPVITSLGKKLISCSDKHSASVNNRTKYFFLIIFPASLLFSCSGSIASNAGKDSSSIVAAASSASGDDMYYELTSVSTGKNINMKMVTEMYVSSKGDMRVEMHTNISFQGH